MLIFVASCVLHIMQPTLLLKTGGSVRASHAHFCCTQGQMASCLADCAEEYRGQLPKLQLDIAEQLATATSSWKGS